MLPAQAGVIPCGGQGLGLSENAPRAGGGDPEFEYVRACVI